MFDLGLKTPILFGCKEPNVLLSLLQLFEGVEREIHLLSRELVGASSSLFVWEIGVSHLQKEKEEEGGGECMANEECG